jgi:hypothetical protein
MIQPIVLRRIKLGVLHQPTGKTRHYSVSGLLPPPSELRIVKSPHDPGVLLLYCNSNGEEFTDTWHQDQDAAMRQAERELQVKPNEWQIVNEA